MEEDEGIAGDSENKTINEEYKIWKKNAPFLYDCIITHALDWPTLTVQWFPDTESPADKPYTLHRLLIGTHTSGSQQDYLQIASVQIPKQVSEDGADDDDDERDDAMGREAYDEERGELGSYTPNQTRIQVTQRIPHKGEVNRARYMPQNLNLIATKTTCGSVFIFDRTKHADEPDKGKESVCKPDIELVGQVKDGFGLDWNPSKPGFVLGASEDRTVCEWDINAYSKANPQIEPLNVYRGHGSIVGDVSWHATKGNIFASVGDDRMLMIWDTLEKSKTRATQTIEAHEKEILCVSFCPSNENLLLTGSSDHTIALWDIRALSSNNNPSYASRRPLHTFHAHTDEVLTLQWSPTHETIFASASADRRINVWDLSAIGVEQSPDDAEDGAPELLFVHGGHTSRVVDLGWASPVGERAGDGSGALGMDWFMASCAEDNVLQVWKMGENVWAGERSKVEEADLE